MSYPKNSASPPPIRARVVSASDGSAITTGVSVTHVAEDRTTAAGAGTLTHIASGEWEYIPTQAETNYTAFSIQFQSASAVGGGTTVHVVTDKRVDALNDLSTSDVGGAILVTPANKIATNASNQVDSRIVAQSYPPDVTLVAIDETGSDEATGLWNLSRHYQQNTWLYANIEEVHGSKPAAESLRRSYEGVLRGSVDTATFAATTTEFETSGLSEAEDNTLVGQGVRFASGPNAGKGYLIIASEGTTANANNKVKLTVQTLPSAPGNGDTFSIEPGMNAKVDATNERPLITARNDNDANVAAHNVVEAIDDLLNELTEDDGSGGSRFKKEVLAQVLEVLTANLTTEGTIGKLLVDMLNATVGSRSSHSAADVRTELEGAGTKLTELHTRASETRLAKLDRDLAHAGDADTYKANVSGLSTFNHTTDEVTLADSEDVYWPRVQLRKAPNAASDDLWVVTFVKNGALVPAASITSPTLTVYKASDGTKLLDGVALSQIGTIDAYSHTESTNKASSNEVLIAYASATVSGATFNFPGIEVVR